MFQGFSQQTFDFMWNLRLNNNKSRFEANKKSFSLIHEQANGEELFSDDFKIRLIRGYTFLMPYYDYFVTLDSDPSPMYERKDMAI